MVAEDGSGWYYMRVPAREQEVSGWIMEVPDRMQQLALTTESLEMTGSSVRGWK